VPALKAALEAESDDQDHLSPLEPRFFEVSHMILTRAADDLPDAAGVRTVLKDLEDFRATKIRRRVADVGRQSDDLFMMRHLTAHELHAHAGMLRVALNGFMAIDHTARDRAGEE
jgi:GINS complex subunit 2